MNDETTRIAPDSGDAKPEQNLPKSQLPSKAQSYLGDYEAVLGANGQVYLHNTMNDHEPLHAVGSDRANGIVFREAQNKGVQLRITEMKEINDLLIANATMMNTARDVHVYVAPFDDGVEIDQGDDAGTRIRVTANEVELLQSGSDTLFFRSNSGLPYPTPAEEGDLDRLDRYLDNLHDDDRMLLKAWLTYTLAHPKVPTTNYVVLCLIGGQGSGKTVLSKIIGSLVSPNRVDTRVMPRNQKDLAVAAKNAHALFFDNLYRLIRSQSDTACVMCNGGHIPVRQLYTDADEFNIPIHVALALNGIHDFVTESDLAQRCLTLRLRTMDADKRAPEKQLKAEQERDLPVIFRGMLDTIAKILARLPDAQVTNHERMIEFVTWLAAMELVDGVPAGTYQATYSHNIQQGQIDSMLDDVLAAAVIEFAEHLRKPWRGEPMQLLTELFDLANASMRRSPDWPNTASMLSRRLSALQEGLRAHGIHVTSGRGKKRWIEIDSDKIRDQF